METRSKGGRFSQADLESARARVETGKGKNGLKISDFYFFDEIRFKKKTAAMKVDVEGKRDKNLVRI